MTRITSMHQRSAAGRPVFSDSSSSTSRWRQLKLMGPPSGQIFPLFSWSLYSRVPDHAVAYAVRITGVGETPLLPPVDLQDFPPAGALACGAWAYHVIQTLSRAASDVDGKGFEAQRVTFEATSILSPISTRAVEGERVPGSFVTRVRIR